MLCWALEPLSVGLYPGSNMLPFVCCVTFETLFSLPKLQFIPLENKDGSTYFEGKIQSSAKHITILWHSRVPVNDSPTAQGKDTIEKIG